MHTRPTTSPTAIDPAPAARDPAAVEAKLKYSLAAAERAASKTASVVGVEALGCSLIDRLTALQKAWAAARPHYHSICAEIVAEDPAMAARAEQLSADHARLNAELLEVVGDSLCLLGAEAGPGQLCDTQGLRARVLGRIAECRAFGRRVNEELLEAHFRDRGRGAC